VSAALAVSGWLLVLVLLITMRRRLELVARAEHELRGPVTVIALAATRLGPGEAAALDVELHRLRSGLDDLAAARRGRRSPVRPEPVRLDAAVAGWRDSLRTRGRRVTVDWQAGPTPIRADPRRLAQALGNLVTNAAEYGDGPVELRGRRSGRGVRVEVRNRPGRGRGLSIATEAVRDSGGELSLEGSEEGVVAALELPLGDAEPPPAA
jgi:signal transduction histidine kinase